MSRNDRIISIDDDYDATDSEDEYCSDRIYDKKGKTPLTRVYYNQVRIPRSSVKEDSGYSSALHSDEKLNVEKTIDYVAEDSDEEDEEDERNNVANWKLYGLTFLFEKAGVVLRTVNGVAERVFGIFSSQPSGSTSKSKWVYRDKALLGLYQLTSHFSMTSPLITSLISNTPSPEVFVGATRQDMERYRYAWKLMEPGSGSFHPHKDLSFSFAASWKTPCLQLYQLGAAQCLQDHLYEEFVKRKSCGFIGSSMGSLIATFLCLNMDLSRLKPLLIELNDLHIERFFGPIAIMSETLMNGLDKLIPEDISHLDNLYICMTDPMDSSSLQKSNFKTKKGLVDALVSSCYVPFLYETPVKIKKRIYIDGGFSCLCPTLGPLTITISPYPGLSNISPLHPSNLPYFDKGLDFRCPLDPKDYEKLFMQGYSDTKEWLQEMVSSGALTSLIFKKIPGL